jgi:hypothetical protein
MRFDGPGVTERDTEIWGRAHHVLFGVLNVALTRNQWLTLREMQARLAEYGVAVQETTVSARLRDLRKQRFGGYRIERRVREGTRAREYRLAGKLADDTGQSTLF